MECHCVSTQQERQERARQEKLELIDKQVEAGTLVIRPMTASERQANPPQPAPDKPPRRRTR